MREDIEAIEGKMQYLNDQVLYSASNLTFYQKPSVGTLLAPSKPGFFAEVFNSLRKGWNLLRSSILHILSVWPFLMLIILFSLLAFALIKKSQAKH